MEGHLDVYLHHGRRWIIDPALSYVGGDVHIVEDFGVDFLTIISAKNVEHIYVLELGMEMNDGLFLI